MAKMPERELLALVEREFSTAMGADGGDISSERAKAWDFYLSKPLGNEIPGQSSVVTSDVSDVIDGLMPSLLRLFTTAENLVSFDPVGSNHPDPQIRMQETERDVLSAEQESDYVNYVFFKQNPAFLILYSWFFDALVQKNGIVKAWWDESEIVTTETYKGQSDESLADLLDDDELEPVERDERTEETVIGDVIVHATVHDITFRRVSKKGRVRIENVPPEEYRISADSRSLDPSEARMVGQERQATRSELLEMGFDKNIVENLPTHSDTERTLERASRRDKADDTLDVSGDRSQDKILVREAYIKVDFDGDGRSELRQVFVAGNEILSNEPADRQPFHVISPQPLPHKHFGRAMSEKVMDVQEVQTTLLRQVLDNLYHTNNPGHAIWDQGADDQTIDDLLTTRVGKIARFKRPISESWAPMAVPFTAAATFPMLEFWDKVKRDRTGISSDSEGLNPDALKNIQQSVLMQAADLSRMKIEAVVRIFAETGIKSLFRHIHELILKHQDRAEMARIRDRWIPVDPQEWRERHNMTINIGLGIGTREQNLLHLDAIWQKQMEMVQSGGLGLTVMPKQLAATGMEIVKNANLKSGEKFFTDPGDGMPQQDDGQDEALQAQLQLAQGQLELQAREQELDRERNLMQHEREIEKLRQAQEKINNDMTVALEQISTKLTEIEVKSGQNVPGAKV